MSKPLPKPHTITTKCNACKDGTMKTGEGKKVPCAYCQGTRVRTHKAVHPSHTMTEKRTEMLAPAGTPRFYSVRNCTACGKEEWEHAAGHFLHGLDYKCKGVNNSTIEECEDSLREAHQGILDLIGLSKRLNSLAFLEEVKKDAS